MYRRERSLREDTFPQRRRTPSFSSSLLDAIYRSIDESNADDEARFKETTMFKKQSSSRAKRGTRVVEEEKGAMNLRQAVRIDDWMEKQSIRSSVLFNSTSSSSESSSGAAFSSSETESSYQHKSKPKLQSSKKQSNPEYRNSEKQSKPKIEGGFTKTKLRALKIYGELKKVKQPISPGGRIASFLNSIFNSDNVRKAKMCYVGAVEDVNLEPKSKSACSSAASYSRSCLSKTPASRGKLGNNGVKRSVRFSTLDVIVGEEDPCLMPIPTLRKIAKNCSVKEGTTAFKFRGFRDNGDADDEDDDDAGSYSSSDLFELDHLVGIGRYREELPVYETTNLQTNQAIANGFIL